MTNEEILKKAIEKAEENGWGDGSLYNIVNDDEVIYQDRFTIIFSHKFAKAFWGEGDKKKTRRMQLIGDKYYPFYQDGWRVHLQQMVLEEGPIKYLEKFLD